MIRSFKEKKIGGAGDIVEIDESCFGRRKYNRGRAVRQVWVLGGVSRNTKETFLVICKKRDKKTLHRLISRHVEKGTTIHTDQWRGYYGLEDLGFKHYCVNHSKGRVQKYLLSNLVNFSIKWWVGSRESIRLIEAIFSIQFFQFLCFVIFLNPSLSF